MFKKTEKYLVIVVALLLLIGTFNFIFEPDMFSVAGNSMFPTIMHGDNCFAINDFFCGKYERNDVVIFKAKHSGKYLVKRIIALPGEHIEIKDNIIKVNGKPVNSYAILNSKMDEVRDEVLNNDEYYMLGDNRPYSKDSRHDGPIKNWQIKGKVLFRWRSLSVP